MHTDPALADTVKLELHPDLVKALNTEARKLKVDYRIETLKPSLLGRLVEKLIGPKS